MELEQNLGGKVVKTTEFFHTTETHDLETAFLKKNFSSFITAGYRGVRPEELIELQDAEQLPDWKQNEAISGIDHSTYISTMYDGEKLVALVAYTVHTPESDPELFNQIGEGNSQYITTENNEEVLQNLASIKSIFTIGETVVHVDYRGQGLSELLRGNAIEQVRAQHMIVVGEVMSPYSAQSIATHPNSSTFWANEYITENQPLPPSLDINVVRAVTDSVGQAYTEYRLSDRGDAYEDGTLVTETYVRPAKFPDSPISPVLQRPLQKIIDRQTPETPICSGITVTFLH